MKWAFQFNKKFQFKYWLYNMMIILGDTFGVIVPILIGLIIDKGLLLENFEYAINLGIITAILAGMGVVLAYFGVVFLEDHCYHLFKDMNHVMMNKINELDASYFNEHPLGEISTLFTTDTNNIIFFLRYIFKTIVVMLIGFVVTLVYGFSIHWLLIISVFSVTPIIVYFSLKFQKKIPKLYKERRNIYSELSNCAQESIEGNLVVKNFNMEKYQIERFNEINEVLENKTVEIDSFANKIFSKINFCAALMNIVYLLVAGWLVINDQFGLGVLVSFYSLIWNLQRPFYELGSYFSAWNDFKTAKDKISNLLNSKSKIQKGTKLLNEKIETISFSNVAVYYDKKVGLKDFSIEIKKGQTIAFIGEVGSGKSTVANLLLRLVDYNEGSLKINQVEIRDFDKISLRNRIGYVAQQPCLFSDSILENIRFGNEEINEENVNHYINMTSAEYVYDLPEGIHTIIGENGVTLSGGEKQRMTLARALSKEPEILILDDITSALDTETEIEVTKNINSLNYDCIKIIVAQKILSVKNADLICVLKNNQIIEVGNHNELLKNHGYYEELNAIQNPSFLGGVNHEN